MVETIRRRIWERWAKQEEAVEEISSSSESKEDPVSDNNSSLEGEYKGTMTPSQLDDNLESSPVPTHRPVTCSMPKKPTSRPKRKAYRTKVGEPGSSFRKKPKG